MNYRTLSTDELERLAYASNDQAAVIELALQAADSEDAFEDELKAHKETAQELEQQDQRIDAMKSEIQIGIEQLTLIADDLFDLLENEGVESNITKRLENAIDVLRCAI